MAKSMRCIFVRLVMVKWGATALRGLIRLWRFHWGHCSFRFNTLKKKEKDIYSRYKLHQIHSNILISFFTKVGIVHSVMCKTMQNETLASDSLVCVNNIIVLWQALSSLIQRFEFEFRTDFCTLRLWDIFYTSLFIPWDMKTCEVKKKKSKEKCC